MAASLQENLELGATGFILDEDTCATNFLVRDDRMERLVAREMEPITPLISKVQALRAKVECSFVIVVGGSGAFLDVADVVICMENFVPKYVFFSCIFLLD